MTKDKKAAKEALAHAAVLIDHLKEIQALRDNPLIMRTQEGIWLCVLMARTVEIMLHGEPRTPLPTRHHK